MAPATMPLQLLVFHLLLRQGRRVLVVRLQSGCASAGCRGSLLARLHNAAMLLAQTHPRGDALKQPPPRLAPVTMPLQLLMLHFLLLRQGWRVTTSGGG